MKALWPSFLLLLVLALPVFAPGQSHTETGQPVKILTWNIRFDNPDDGPNAWSERKDWVISVVKAQKPDIFCLQEALISQVRYFENAFKNFQRVGLGRDDGKEGGEFSPVFVNMNKFLIVETSTFWLSQTPHLAGSRGWDAACNRVVTWAKVRERITGKDFFVFNTHFDHIGLDARKNSALLLLHAIDSLAGELPALVTGDFNAKPTDEPIRIIMHSEKPALSDVRSLAKSITGPGYTFTGFKVSGLPGEYIDYIFVKGGAKVATHAVIDTNNRVFYPSDHLPVLASLRLLYPK